jgi:hypothetical protein
MVTDAPIYTYRDTLYTRWVDWFPKVLLAVSLALLTFGIIRAAAVRLRGGRPQ